jgi:hypothetical protein
MIRNIVKNTTESKYVSVSPIPSGDLVSEAASASKIIDEKYATETPDETLI